eukprot:417407-Amphidinium_carterae.2
MEEKWGGTCVVCCNVSKARSMLGGTTITVSVWVTHLQAPWSYWCIFGPHLVVPVIEEPSSARCTTLRHTIGQKYRTSPL